jgi:hypothetical protein
VGHSPDRPRAGRRERRFAERCREIEAEGAREAGELGFAARPLVQAHLPYRPVPGVAYTRRSGPLRLHLLAPPEIGLPYGRYPRLFLAWLSTQAVRRRSPEIPLDKSLSAFLRMLEIGVSGGASGPIRRFRDQVRRLLATNVTVVWERERSFGTEGFHFAAKSYLWWDRPQEVAGGGLVRLSREFYDELLRAPVPLDLRVLRALPAPMAIDLYGWLTYRTFALKQPLFVSWPALYEQFGTQTRRLRDFRRSFGAALTSVLAVYPRARVRFQPEGLLVLPCDPQVLWPH